MNVTYNLSNFLNDFHSNKKRTVYYQLLTRRYFVGNIIGAIDWNGITKKARGGWE